MKEQWREVNNVEAERRLAEKLDQLLLAIDTSRAQNLWEPTLILIYAGIDAMAWLDRPAGSKDVIGPDFIKWCDRYLLLPADNRLTGEDLYGARCGLLHSHTGESKKHRDGKVVKLFYSRQQGDGETNLIQLNMNERFWPLWVDIDILAVRFREAVKQFCADFATDPERRARICDRVLDSYMVEVSPIQPPN